MRATNPKTYPLHQVLVSTEGCELVFFQQDKVAWARSEALAYVTHARMVRLLPLAG